MCCFRCKFLLGGDIGYKYFKMTELSANVIAWEEGEPALQLLAPEQAMTAVVFSRLGQVFFLTEDGRVYLLNLKQDGLEEVSL